MLACTESMLSSVEFGSDSTSCHTIIAFGGEDKKLRLGLTQAIVAMLIISTHLGLKAIAQGNFFTRGIIFGYTRMTEVGKVLPLLLLSDYANCNCRMFRGKSHVSASMYITNRWKTQRKF